MSRPVPVVRTAVHADQSGDPPQPFGGSYHAQAHAELVPARPHLADGPPDGGDDYSSRFEAWYDRASIRCRPRRVLEPAGPLYFSPELVPVAAHPLVAGCGEAAVRRVLVHRLYDYLHFTTELEQLAVIPVAARIARGRAGIDLPEGMRADAYKIVTDEAWHAQFSYDLLRQVEQATGVRCPGFDVPAFVTRLDAVRMRLDPGVRGLEGGLFAIVSETLISTILSDLPRDERLPSAVRDLVLDHAVDEGRHHAYFHSLLRRLWPRLTASQRRAVGPWLPEIIRAFLVPDTRALAAALREIGLSTDQVRQVFAESMPDTSTMADVAMAARSAVRYFAEVGALDDARTRDSFDRAHLLVNPS
jgi:P-aminobenzoate N-oxygenase AurF